MRRAAFLPVLVLSLAIGCRESSAPTPPAVELTLRPRQLRVATGDTVRAEVVVRNLGPGALRYPLSCGQPPVALRVYTGDRVVGGSGLPVCLDGSGQQASRVLAAGDSLVVTQRWRTWLTGSVDARVPSGTYGLQAVWYAEEPALRSAPVLVEVLGADAP